VLPDISEISVPPRVAGVLPIGVLPAIRPGLFKHGPLTHGDNAYSSRQPSKVDEMQPSFPACRWRTSSPVGSIMAKAGGDWLTIG
jgi:hypothetical protein